MRKFVAITIIISLFTFASPAHAAGWSANVRIASLEISNVNVAGTWLSFTATPFASHTCSNKAGQYLVGGGADNVSKITAAASQALISGRTVSVYWAGECGNGYPIIVGLTVR